jgi:hypothetical protein
VAKQQVRAMTSQISRDHHTCFGVLSFCLCQTALPGAVLAAAGAAAAANTHTETPRICTFANARGAQTQTG